MDGAVAARRRPRRQSTLPAPAPNRAETRRKVLVWVMVGILLFSVLVVMVEAIGQG